VPRLSQTGRARAGEADATVRPRADVGAIVAVASSSRPEGVVLQAAPRSGQAEDAGSDEI
jgi:hypothetical protein